MSDTPSKPLPDHDEFHMRAAFPLATEKAQAYLCYGSPGWEELIWWGLSEIEDVLKENPGLEFIITAIKSKFGTLRFYYRGGNEEIEAIVATMEARSVTTCERCGGLGRLRGRGWLYTACQEHTEEKDRYSKQKENK